MYKKTNKCTNNTHIFGSHYAVLLNVLATITIMPISIIKTEEGLQKRSNFLAGQKLLSSRAGDYQVTCKYKTMRRERSIPEKGIIKVGRIKLFYLFAAEENVNKKSTTEQREMVKEHTSK